MRDKWRGTPAERGYDRAWRKVRGEVLERDHYLCQRCLTVEHRVTPATEVHHIRKIITHPELRLSPDNLTSCCRDCHELMELTAE